MLAFGGRKGKKKKGMYFLRPCSTNSHACKAKLPPQKNPANLELTEVKRRVHDSIQLKLPALKEEKHPRHTI